MVKEVDWEQVDGKFDGEEALAMICIYCGGIAVAVNLDPEEVGTKGQVMNRHLEFHYLARHHKKPYPYNFFKEHVYFDKQVPTRSSIC